MNETASDSSRWQFWIDRGGTFTDIVACKPDVTLITHKLLCVISVEIFWPVCHCPASIRRLGAEATWR